MNDAAERQKQQEEQAKLAKQTEEERLDALRAEYMRAGYEDKKYADQRQLILSKVVSEPNASYDKKKELMVYIDVCSTTEAAENKLMRYSGEGLPSRSFISERTVVYATVTNGSFRLPNENDLTKDALTIYTTFMAKIPKAAPVEGNHVEGNKEASAAFCPGCGQAVTPGVAFCSGCGQRLDRTCSQCGRADNSGGSFCSGCGNRLG